MITYSMGQHVWWATARSSQKSVICPDCIGKMFLTVILGDESHVTIECATCRAGDEPPRGYVLIDEYAAEVDLGEISGIEINAKGTRYHIGYYMVEAENVFDSKEPAEARAAQLLEEHDKEEMERFTRKANETRTWAWHVHYHRKGMKQAQRDLAYHTAKLEQAKLRTKQEKERT